MCGTPSLPSPVIAELRKKAAVDLDCGPQIGQIAGGGLANKSHSHLDLTKSCSGDLVGACATHLDCSDPLNWRPIRVWVREREKMRDASRCQRSLLPQTDAGRHEQMPTVIAHQSMAEWGSKNSRLSTASLWSPWRYMYLSVRT